MLLLLKTAGTLRADDPLKQVENDQAGGSHSSADIFNRNIALHSRRDLTHASSYKPGRFAWYAHDGNDKTAWMAGPEEAEACLEISWGLAEAIDHVIVLESNPKGIQSLTLELYDGQGWEAVAADRAQKRGRFSFSPRPASALRIRIQTDGNSAGIAEVEVYATQSPGPLSRYGSADLIAAMETSTAVILFDGSPYAYSRAGRNLISPRIAETCLADEWTNAVLAAICTTLGGTSEAIEETRLRIRLNGQVFSLDTDHGGHVIDLIKVLAHEARLEFLHRDPLVMVGQGLDSLNQPDLAAELASILGRNPFRMPSRPESRPDAVVTPTLDHDGTTYEWAGFRATALPGTNADAWLKYAETKAVRTWINAPRYMDMYIRPEETIETVEDFERCRALVRSAPENNSFVAMRAFLNKHHAALTSEFGTYQALGIDVINQTGAKNWPDTCHDDFINWSSSYVLTYYLAKNFGVAAHQFGNEPDWYFNQSTDEQICRRLTLIADAVHSAIEDVNRDYQRNLKAVYSAPVLASDFRGRTARLMMRHLHTRYDGSESSERLFQLFNRHRYSGRPHQNALEVRQAKQMMQEEAGEVLPQVFTELNFATGASWRRPTTTFTNDTPDVFTSLASIWGRMMQEQGVYGIFVFKFNDPGIWSWKDTGRFSNVVTYSMHPEQDADADRKALAQISYGTKNFEVCRLFSRGFHGSRPLLRTDTACSDLQYRCWTTVDEARQRFFIWSVQANEFTGYELEFDLRQLKLPPGTLITAETVSGAHHGEVTHVMALPDNQRIRLHQPPKSGMLLTLHARPLTHQTLTPVADATVNQGTKEAANFGTDSRLRVGRHTQTDNNRISFLKFELPAEPGQIEQAVLELHGQSISHHAYDGGFLVRVYSMREDDWEERQITAANAPNVYRTVSSLREVDLEHYPVGHVTCFHDALAVQVDITQAVHEAQRAGRQHLSLVLIREQHWPGEKTDAVSALFSSREAGGEHAPALHLWNEEAASTSHVRRPR